MSQAEARDEDGQKCGERRRQRGRQGAGAGTQAGAIIVVVAVMSYKVQRLLEDAFHQGVAVLAALDLDRCPQAVAILPECAVKIGTECLSLGTGLDASPRRPPSLVFSFSHCTG